MSVQIDVTSRPAYSMAYVRLASGESVVAESGALVAMSTGSGTRRVRWLPPCRGGWCSRWPAVWSPTSLW